MRRFQSILIVCDEMSVNDDVIDRAIHLAKSNHARITLVDTIEAAPGELTRLFGAFPGTRAQDVEHEVVEFHRARLATVGAPIKSAGIHTSELVLQGNPFVEIIKKVLRDGHDLVIKGAGGGEGRRLFFASTDLHLMRKCPCPVWIMKRSGQRQYSRILAAVDPDPEDQERNDLNTLIMDLATSLARMDNSDLHIVNAWKLQEEDTLRHSGFARAASAVVDQMVAEQRKNSQAKLNELMERYPQGVDHRSVHLLKGDARDVIPQFAAENGVELVVMGTVGRVGIRGLIIGNTAEAILNQVMCSVIAVKPPGFDTPVRLDGDSVQSSVQRARA